MQCLCLNWSLTRGVNGLILTRVVMNDCSNRVQQFDPQQGQFGVALQPIFNRGDLCFVFLRQFCELLLWPSCMVTSIELLRSVTCSTRLSIHVNILWKTLLLFPFTMELSDVFGMLQTNVSSTTVTLYAFSKLYLFLAKKGKFDGVLWKFEPDSTQFFIIFEVFIFT